MSDQLASLTVPVKREKRGRKQTEEEFYYAESLSKINKWKEDYKTEKNIKMRMKLRNKITAQQSRLKSKEEQKKLNSLRENADLSKVQICKFVNILAGIVSGEQLDKMVAKLAEHVPDHTISDLELANP
jgi:hypothetical protein